MRYARVSTRKVTVGEVANALPANYFVQEANGELVILGEDYAGWTLDGYVIPRLASGLIFAEEIFPAAEPPEYEPDDEPDGDYLDSLERAALDPPGFYEV